MLFKHLDHLSTKKIILASGSPRRREILDSINLPHTVIKSSFKENLVHSDFSSTSEYVTETALQKAKQVASLQSCKDAELIIAADTMVVLDDQIMGKPGDNATALKMLKQLSSRTHTVYTGVALIWPNSSTVKFCESTSVKFASLTDEIIHGYVSTNEPLDKAGAYGIQGLGGSLIESINGDYYTVMGLPLHKLCVHINEYYK